ncbi:hypothetical protein KC336_g51 [Hortaea werneckii]|nr:hypothetical protein KC336_g51 [Hortaea werneckii]
MSYDFGVLRLIDMYHPGRSVKSYLDKPPSVGTNRIRRVRDASSRRSLGSLLGVSSGSKSANTSHLGSHLDRKRRQQGLSAALYASSTGFEDNLPKHVPKNHAPFQPNNDPVENSLNELMNNARPKKRSKLQAQRDRSSNSGGHKQRGDVGKDRSERVCEAQAPPPRPAPTPVIDLTLQDDEPPPDDEPLQEAVPQAFRYPVSDGSVQNTRFHFHATSSISSHSPGFSPGIVTPAPSAAGPPLPVGMPTVTYHWTYPGLSIPSLDMQLGPPILRPTDCRHVRRTLLSQRYRSQRAQVDL